MLYYIKTRKEKEQKLPQFFPHVLFLEPQTGNAIHAFLVNVRNKQEGGKSLCDQALSHTNLRAILGKSKQALWPLGLWRQGPMFFLT